MTGPESTGKTTLARRLGHSLGTEWVPEASRTYAERVARELIADDAEPIAREHIALADAAADRVRAGGGSVLVLDTDLLSTVVYARHYYGSSSQWLDDQARARQSDLYLLCDVDVAWIADGIRDRPDHRDAMFALFRDALAAYGASTVVVHGDWEARWRIAMSATAGPSFQGSGATAIPR